MNKTNKFALAAMAASIVAGVAATPAFAATSGTEQASIGVTGGSLAITAGGSIAFPGVTLNGQQQTPQASLPANVNVTDSTGSGSGYHVTVQAAQFSEVAPSAGFASGTTAKTLPTGSLALANLSGITANGTTSAAPVGKLSASNIIDNNAAVMVASAAANTGMGSYDVAFPSNALTLTLNPATTFTDATNYAGAATPYSSVVTWTVVTGP